MGSQTEAGQQPPGAGRPDRTAKIRHRCVHGKDKSERRIGRIEIEQTDGEEDRRGGDDQGKQLHHQAAAFMFRGIGHDFHVIVSLRVGEMEQKECVFVEIDQKGG